MAIDQEHIEKQPVTECELAVLGNRLAKLRTQLAEAAAGAGRSPGEIVLIGVSKLFPAEAAAAACRLGLSDLGENRVQELLPKIDRLAEQGLHPRWHLIGTLQKNKVRQIIGRTHLIHSVDSLELLLEIDRRSQNTGCVTDILLQVNPAGEATKHGLSPEDLLQVTEQALRLPGVRLRGLMAMAPLFSDPDQTLPVFARTRDLLTRMQELAGRDRPLPVLSMGMSLDFVQAIRCGATHVRIGTAIFGPRL